MNKKSLITMLSLMILVLGIGTRQSGAQQTGSDPQTAAGPYTINSSVEVGVRGVSVDGNADKYRSDLNYQPGVRIFDSSFLLQPKNGVALGQPFDNLLVTSSGWGGDPSGYLRLNAEKLSWYRFDATVRHFDYFNSLTNLALNQHISNIDHKMGDFDLTLLPQNERIKFTVGYSMDRTNGPALTTFDYARDEFPVFAPIRYEANDYRFGIDAKVASLDLSFQQGFRYFKQDTTHIIDNPDGVFTPGNNPTNTSVINDFHRDLPTRGRIPYTRFSLHTMIAKKLDLTGRFIYQSATTRFTMLETVTGRDASGNNIVLDEFTASGDVKRPNGIGDFGATFFATDKLRISETFRINSFHIDGGNALSEALFRTRNSAGGVVTVPPLFVDTLSFRTTRHRRAVNTLEVDYDFHPRLSVHVGHRYTDRHIELARNDITLGQPLPAEEEPEILDNRTNTWFGGFRAKPLGFWTLYFDLEKGETDNVFTRIDNYNFVNVRARSRIAPTRTLSFNVSIVTKDNDNPTLVDNITKQQFGANINSRILTSSVDWTPDGRFSLSSGYTHTHITSEAAIIFFSNSVRRQGLSRYFLRDNFAFLSGFVQINPRLAFYGAYRIHHDDGQGDRVSGPTELVGSYPQQFQSPEFRWVVRLHDRIDWNVGYQYFDFQEKFPNLQRYQAHLPYTSLRIYFNRGNGN